MEKLPEFVMNHPLLFAALAASIVFIIMTELRRKTGARAVSAREAIQLINDRDAAVVDIREVTEYKAGHIINALHIPVARFGEEAARIAGDKTRPVIVYCKTGTAAPAACERLRAQGYGQVCYLKNGIYGWLDENLPLVN
ncbi:MAG TPA: rhodanese-like domain-containing protein [Gammaproteobacteria bacterium]